MKTFTELLEMKINLTNVPILDVSQGPRVVTRVSPSFFMTGKEVLDGIARARVIQAQLQEAIDACEAKLAEAQQS